MNTIANPSQNLRTLFDARGLSQRRLAKEAGIDRTSLCHMLNPSNPRPIGRKAAHKLANYFSVPVEQFLSASTPDE